MTEFIKKETAKNEVKLEKIQISNDIIRLIEDCIKKDNFYTSDLLKKVKKHCDDLIISDF